MIRILDPIDLAPGLNTKPTRVAVVQNLWLCASRPDHDRRVTVSSSHRVTLVYLLDAATGTFRDDRAPEQTNRISRRERTEFASSALATRQGQGCLSLSLLHSAGTEFGKMHFIHKLHARANGKREQAAAGAHDTQPNNGFAARQCWRNAGARDSAWDRHGTVGMRVCGRTACWPLQGRRAATGAATGRVAVKPCSRSRPLESRC